MVQIPADNRAELLFQVDPLRQRHAGSHHQTLQENPFAASESNHVEIRSLSCPSKGIAGLLCALIGHNICLSAPVDTEAGCPSVLCPAV